MSGLTYLITGSNRGIGKGLLEVFVSRPDTTVIAAVRDVEKSTKDLSAAKTGKGSKVIIVKIDSTSETDAAVAVKELESKHNIIKIDAIISCAGSFGAIAPALETPIQDIRTQFEINTLGPLHLIRAFHPLLLASPLPKFLVLTSSVGSIASIETIPAPFFGYGLSKAATNYMVRKLHFENEGLTVMAFNPGWVRTAMGSGAAKGVGMEDAPMELAESVGRLVGLFDAAGREKSGTFTNVTGEVIPW